MPLKILQRPILQRGYVRLGVGALLVAALVLVISRIDTRPSLGHVHIAVLSGAPEGNYHALVDQLAAAAAKRSGRIDNVPSRGSAENIGRLAAASRSCDVAFAIAQSGMPEAAAGEPPLQLVGRLAKAESVMFLGLHADAIHAFADLKGQRIGIGPEGSGTAIVTRQILDTPEFAPLGLTLSAHEVKEQLDLAARGELDLAAFVIDEDAELVKHAVRDLGLQIAGFSHADVVARRFSHLRTGRIGAGQYDPVRLLPAEDKRVLRVDTMVLANACAKRSETIGLLVALTDVFPDFVRHNKDTPNTSGYDLTTASRSYFEHEGPEIVDEYVPRAGDLMPPSNWAYVVMGISILFNLMGLGNRFVLWRIDAARVHAEAQLAHLFGAKPLDDIARLDPKDHPDSLEGVSKIIADLEALSARCRKLSLSLLVPMGGEMVYRYQESLMLKTLGVLHAYRDRARATKQP